MVSDYVRKHGVKIGLEKIDRIGRDSLGEYIKHGNLVLT